MPQTVVIKVQSISDIITNSSTEVFIVYDSSNIDSIKHVINAILSIDGHYTFDDLFTIKMTPAEYAVEDLYENWENVFHDDPKPENIDAFWEFINALSQEELNRYVGIWEGCQTYYWEAYPFYQGYSVSIKEGVEKTDKLQKAVDAIRSLDTIFSLDYTCN
jgi:hypothetical protein